jgi:L-alanine-DL-glutamate epimerase-like enolase superfamily enzyme
MATAVEVAVERLAVEAFTVPTEDEEESDGTATWSSTTMVVVEAHAGDEVGLGYTYADASAADLARRVLAPLVEGADVFAGERSWQALLRAVRNPGRQGVAATAISAVDAALWDLRARLLKVPLCDLLGRARDRVPIYGSGGFTSYDRRQLETQLSGWAEAGIPRVKMKVGRHPDDDPGRVAAAKAAIGPDVELFVDANGAYTVQQALRLAERFAEQDVRWFEEPVSSDDLAGLRQVRERVPAGMAVAAGEYGWGPWELHGLLEAEAVDVLQADASRCLGITGFLRAAALSEAHGRPLSGHCAPALHLHVAAAAGPLVHLEWFHDHARIEHLLLDGAPEAAGGFIEPDRSRPGNGLTLRRSDAERLAV